MLKNITPSLPEHGKIKAGTKGEEVVSGQGKKFRLPQKLDHYIITTMERDPKSGLLVLENELMDKLKKDKSLVDSKGNLTSIPIRLLYNDINLNFFTRTACYTNGKCVCSGDGKTARTRDGRDVKCLSCKQLEPDYKGKDKCKSHGKLIVIIDGTDTVGACHVLRTTSINTIKAILGSLMLYKTATGGLLAFLPFHLMLRPMVTTTPDGTVRTIYVSSIIYRGNIEDLQTKALEMAKAKTQFLIEMDNVEAEARKLLTYSTESPQEEKDIQAEFHPDNDNEDVQDAEVVTGTGTDSPEGIISDTDKKETSTKTALDVAKESVEKESEKEPELGTIEDVSIENKDNKEPEQVGDIGRPTPDIQMITKDQKHQIVKLKKQFKIATGAPWDKVLELFEVKTANDLTFDQAEKFIESLNANPT